MGGYKPMDHAPMPHGGGSTDDQCAQGKREKNGVTQRCPASRAGAFARREGREEERFRYQEINAVPESFLHGGSGSKSLTHSSASCIVSRIHVILPNKSLSLDRAQPIRVGRFHQKRTCPDHIPCLLSIDHRPLRM